jgi:hypothetical protein
MTSAGAHDPRPLRNALAGFPTSSAFNNGGSDNVILVGHAARHGTRDTPAPMFHRGPACAAPAT